MVWKLPLWLLPVLAAAYNCFRVVTGLLCEGRLKATGFKYMFLYASTVRDAYRGNMEPFFQVLSGMYGD